MNYLVFDVETTGLSNRDEVIQFAGLLLDTEFRIKKVINFYCNSCVHVNEQITALTHIDNKFLYENAKGKTFEDNFLNCPSIYLEDLIWIGYNNVAFDNRLINNTLTNNGLPSYNFGTEVTHLGNVSGRHSFDLLKYLASRLGYKQKLSVCASKLPYSQENLDALYLKLSKISGLAVDVKLHNALYDAMLTWLLLVQNRNGVL